MCIYIVRQPVPCCQLHVCTDDVRLLCITVYVTYVLSIEHAFRCRHAHTLSHTHAHTRGVVSSVQCNESGCVCRFTGPVLNGIEATVQATPEEGGQIELHMVSDNACNLMHRILWAKKLIDTMILYIGSCEHELVMARRPSVLVCSPLVCMSKTMHSFGPKPVSYVYNICLWVEICSI